MADNFENKFKVKLENPAASGNFRRVVFHVSPDVIENMNVNYKTLDPVHLPGTIQAYTNSAARTFNLGSIKIISRTQEEATRTLHTINVLRSWTKPRFGINSSTLTKENRENRTTWEGNEEQFVNNQERNNFLGIELLGAPPPVLLLSAYSSANNRGNIYKVPVIIMNLSIPYPSDVDYIPTMANPKYPHIDEGTPVPIIFSLDMQLTESHSPREFSKFNLDKFKLGKLEGF